MAVYHGLRFPDGVDELHVELWCFAHRECDGEAKWGHFRRAVDLAFNCPDSIRRVVWNPWTDGMIREFIGGWEQKRFVGVAGCSSSGKSDAAALYVLMSYWSRPSETTAVLMSTSKQSARLRVWKSVEQLWAQARRKGCPGKLNPSEPVIKGLAHDGSESKNAGIFLYAAGKADAGEACDNLIGLKNPNILVVADEHPNLGDGILDAVWLNLTSNERVTFIGLGNPFLFSDPFSELCEPEGGWQSIDEHHKRWRTKYGTAIRFNAEESPRITESDGEKYFWQPDQAYCDRIAAGKGGRNSRGYYRFVKAFWCPDGAGNSVYQESEFVLGGSMDLREPQWGGPPAVVVLSALDPAFTNGGDRACAMVAKVGVVDGRAHLHLCHTRMLEEDSMEKGVPLSHQLVRQWRKVAFEWAVSPYHALMDGTGSGISFGHIVDAEWSAAVEKINFCSKPSRSAATFAIGHSQEYYDKASELWIQPKTYLRAGQITGITPDLMKELASREYHRTDGKRLRVESKKDHKVRNGGDSPDLADAFLMLVDKAISLGIFASDEKRKVSEGVKGDWRKVAARRAIKRPLGRKVRF
jgi:hypothetical protein